MRKRVLVVVFISLFTCKAWTQGISTDSTVPVAYAVGLYQKFLYPEKGLYTGRHYLEYRSGLNKGHPYFLNDGFAEGSVTYDGMPYKVSLAYDIAKDLLVTWDPYQKYLLELVNEKVDSFTISGYPFVRLSFPAANSAGIDDGFYRMVYDGKTRVVKKETKLVKEEINVNNRIERSIQEGGVYYIRKDGRYHSVTSKTAVLKVLGDKKKELNQFIRQNKLNFSDNMEAAIFETAAYYDSLTR